MNFRSLFDVRERVEQLKDIILDRLAIAPSESPEYLIVRDAAAECRFVLEKLLDELSESAEELGLDDGPQDVSSQAKLQKRVSDLKHDLAEIKRHLRDREIACDLLKGKLRQRNKTLDYIREKLYQEVILLKQKLFDKQMADGTYVPDDFNLFDFLQLSGAGAGDDDGNDEDEAARISALQNRMKQEAEKEKNALETKYKKLLEDRNREIARLEQEKLEEAANMKAEHQKQLQAVQDECASQLQSFQDQMELERTQYEAQVAAMQEEFALRVQTMEEEFASKEAEFNQRITDLEERVAEEERLRLEQQEQYEAAMVALREECERQMEQQRQQHEEEMARMRRELELLEEKLREVKAQMQAEIDRLMAELARKERELIEVQKQAAGALAENEKLKLKLKETEEARKKSEKLAEENMKLALEARAAVEEANQRLAAKQKEFETATASIRAAHEEQIQSMRNSFEEERRSWEEVKNEMLRQHEEMALQLANAQAAARDLESHMASRVASASFPAAEDDPGLKEMEESLYDLETALGQSPRRERSPVRKERPKKAVNRDDRLPEEDRIRWKALEKQIRELTVWDRLAARAAIALEKIQVRRTMYIQRRTAYLEAALAYTLRQPPDWIMSLLPPSLQRRPPTLEAPFLGNGIPSSNGSPSTLHVPRSPSPEPVNPDEAARVALGLSRVDMSATFQENMFKVRGNSSIGDESFAVSPNASFDHSRISSSSSSRPKSASASYSHGSVEKKRSSPPRPSPQQEQQQQSRWSASSQSRPSSSTSKRPPSPAPSPQQNNASRPSSSLSQYSIPSSPSASFTTVQLPDHAVFRGSGTPVGYRPSPSRELMSGLISSSSLSDHNNLNNSSLIHPSHLDLSEINGVDMNASLQSPVASPIQLQQRPSSSLSRPSSSLDNGSTGPVRQDSNASILSSSSFSNPYSQPASSPQSQKLSSVSARHASSSASSPLNSSIRQSRESGTRPPSALLLQLQTPSNAGPAPVGSPLAAARAFASVSSPSSSSSSFSTPAGFSSPNNSNVPDHGFSPSKLVKRPASAAVARPSSRAGQLPSPSSQQALNNDNNGELFSPTSIRGRFNPLVAQSDFTITVTSFSPSQGVIVEKDSVQPRRGKSPQPNIRPSSALGSHSPPQDDDQQAQSNQQSSEIDGKTFSQLNTGHLSSRRR